VSSKAGGCPANLQQGTKKTRKIRKRTLKKRYGSEETVRVIVCGDWRQFRGRNSVYDGKDLCNR